MAAEHGGAEALLERTRPNRPRRLGRRELRVEAVVAGALVVVAVAMAMLVPDGGRSASAGLVALYWALYVAAARVRLYTGAGSALPTQLVFVPMLVTLPLGEVPLIAACGMAASALIDVALGRAHAERVVTAAGDAWYAVAPVGVLALGGDAWPVFTLAFAAQCAFDVLASVVREWAGRGIVPGLQLRVMASVYVVDALLTPVGLLVAVTADDHAWAPLVCAPLLLLLAIFARDRRLRIERAIGRLDELERERERLQSAIRRVGEAFATQIDARALLGCVLDTAMDALPASRGRARAGADVEARGWDAPAEDLAGALEAAESAALAGGCPPPVAAGAAWAIARPLRVGDEGGPVLGALSLARPQRPFTPEEQDLLGYLAGQAAISLQNALLHEELRKQATVDELTGLSNHRRLQQALDEELERSRRFPAPLSLLILDIDDFKAVNDTYGHLQGDVVLRAVAGAVREHCRSVDESARYGGEELAVMLRGTDLEGAFSAAETIRRAIEKIEPIPGIRVTASIGVAELDRGEASKNDLIAAADEALYDAKRSGKNRTVAAERPAAQAPR